MFLYLTVVACAGLLALLVYRYDLYDKEPWYLLLLVTVVGYAAFWAVGFVEDFSNQRLGFNRSGDLTAGHAAVAASHEELAKLLLVVLVAVAFRKHFNDPMDGLMYGAFAGLGMALEESLMYVQLSFASAPREPGIDVAGREVTRLVLHILMGGISGFGVGLFVEHARLRFWPAMLLGWLAASMTIHFLWDYLCGIPAAAGADATLQAEVFRRGAAVLLMIAAMLLFGFSVMLGTRMSREKFAPASTKRLWRWLPFR